MKFSNVLFRQHIGFMFKKHWRVQGQRTPLETSARLNLEANGYKVVDAKEYFFQKPKIQERIEIVGPVERPPKLDETHPFWQEKQCHLYKDSNVLLEGVKQAQVLTKTLVFNEFPENLEICLEKMTLSQNLERSMQQAVLVSHLLDAQQEKTAVIKDPERPSRVFKRNMGITDFRKNQLLSLRLLNHCERFAGHLITKDRKIINNVFFCCSN
jgi:large subunit ribosomal protein L37